MPNILRLDNGMLFGPVAEAAHGGSSNPTFDLIVGTVVLALTWIGFSRENARKPVSLSAALGVTVICCVFLYSGLSKLFGW